MASSIVPQAPFRAHEPCAWDADGAGGTAPARLHAWSGASGRRYVFSVYSLIACPPPPRGVYLLVRRGEDGTCDVLSSGLAADEAPTLNLASIRQRGATLGANEVHVLTAESDEERRAAACDLRAGRFGVPVAEPAQAARA